MKAGPFTAVLFAIALTASCGTSATGDHSPDRQARRIVQTTSSPFCPGKTLDSCPSPKAGEWRREIDAWTAEGVSEAEIRERLQSRVPIFPLEVPPVRWGGLIPIAALLVATLVMWLVARPMLRRRHAADTGLDLALDETLDHRIDEELALLDQ